MRTNQLMPGAVLAALLLLALVGSPAQGKPKVATKAKAVAAKAKAPTATTVPPSRGQFPPLARWMNNNGADRKNVFPSATGIVLKIGLCVDPETQLKRPWIAITFTSVGGDVLDLDNVAPSTPPTVATVRSDSCSRTPRETRSTTSSRRARARRRRSS